MSDQLPDTQQKLRQFEVIGYEVKMFYATYDITLSPALDQPPLVLANAVEESAVLHTRILCDVFLDRGHAKDNIELSQLFQHWDADNRYDKLKEMIEILRKRYGTHREQES
jgi:hypothetical protein